VTVLPLALVALLTVAVIMAATIVVSRIQGRVVVIDVTWGLMFLGVGIVAAVLGEGTAWRRWVLFVLVALWSGRLAWHIGRRLATHHSDSREDPRYAAMLEGHGFGFALVRVFLVQMVAAFVISWPLISGGGTDAEWPVFVWVGVVVWIVGLFFEAVGDQQLSAYRAKPRDARPQVLDTGLWAWTRHPNYFGDACIWWGLWLAGGLASGWGPALVTVVSPVLMTLFVRNVTGAKLLEKTMSQRSGWDEYAARVPMFFPRPPRR
jgi:steroid 5-alpha reductase family enzyme